MDNIIKLNAEQQIVTAALMVPDETDLQGDSISADEIQACCHRFAEDYLSGRASMNLEHEQDTEDILVVESFIAPVNYTDHGKKIKKGTWILSSKILNKDVGPLQAGRVHGLLNWGFWN